MDDSSQDEGDRGNADKHYQFVFSSAGNPRQDMKFCDCGEGAFSGVKNNESYSTLRAKLCQRNDGMSSANAVEAVVEAWFPGFPQLPSHAPS